jgi:5-oxoprolinase (ATP-hydrolysing) subunit A
MYVIDLNCDMGESFGNYKLGFDEELMNYATSVNIACGFHGGDPQIMRKTVQMAIEKNVGIGAHPGFQDLAGFGRREMNLTPQEVFDIVVYQIGALYGFVKSEGGLMQHVKPHGALYNMAAKNSGLAEAIAEAVYKINPELILFGLAGSELLKAGKNIGLRTASEAFADRTYLEDGTLTSRRDVNALIHDPEAAVKQVIQIVKDHSVSAVQGEKVPLTAETICLHGDGENAVTFAMSIREGLTQNGIKVKNFL